MKMRLVCVLLALFFVCATLAAADGLYGACYGKGGEKCLKGNHTISTSWNNKKAYPDSGGRYYLNLGSSVDKRITVYCDGKSVGSVYVNDDVEFNVHCR
ncbi:MAG: hypothetical protein P9L99_19710 [Candidatus Lernaella stagnicola]|nr:hypothetical protein [Candidatus Lernaella stagnicola]